MKKIIIIALTLLGIGEAEAQTRVPIYTRPAFAQGLCGFVTLSVAPDWPEAQQRLALGDCPPQSGGRPGTYAGSGSAIGTASGPTTLSGTGSSRFGGSSAGRSGYN